MRSLEIIRKFGPAGLLAVSFAGLLDSAYLTANHFKGTPPDCVLFSGCDVVTTSSYAVIGFVPVALLGMIFYFTVFFLCIAFFTGGNRFFLRVIFYLSSPALIFTAYLVFLQLFVIKAICVYCMFSAVVSVTIFLLSFFSGKKFSGKGN